MDSVGIRDDVIKDSLHRCGTESLKVQSFDIDSCSEKLRSNPNANEDKVEMKTGNKRRWILKMLLGCVILVCAVIGGSLIGPSSELLATKHSLVK